MSTMTETRAPDQMRQSAQTWWQEMPGIVRLAVWLVSFSIVVSFLTGVVMGLWLLYILVKAGI